ncbi:MAG: MlaD family protein [Candidatus Fibromonas sp.]|jgi:ABC-type transporter Mla subunit MlaD|nr:MlaD family protein [Candidatus Fibromonas sp.]
MKSDRLIGTITIAVALLLIIYVAFSMWRKESRARDTILVQFPEMGALQNEDIVAVRGLAIGHVASITRLNEKALVEIDLDEPRIFRKDTRFRNVSPDIMGSRSIAIEPGTSGEFAESNHIFDGEFEPGFAEVLALSDFAKEQVAILMEFIRLLHAGDEKDPPLAKKIEDIVKECEDLTVALGSLINSIEKQTSTTLDKVSYYSGQISDASVKIGKTLDTIRVQAEEGIESAEKVVLKIDETIENLTEILTEFENSPITVALLDKREIINDIDSLRSTLQAFVNSIDKQGVKIYDEKGKRKSMISLKNIYLFRETARSKAKKRAEQENKN